MRTIILSLATILTACAAAAAQQAEEGRGLLEPVVFTRVTIEDEFWAPRLEANRTVSVPHVMKWCEDTKRIANFARAGKLEKGGFEGIYFNDSDVHKALEGAAYTLHLKPDPKLEALVDSVIDKMVAAQQPDGYLNSYYTLTGPDKRWTDLVVKHELYCGGHMLEAAIAYHHATGKRKYLDSAIRFMEHIDSIFGPDKRHGVPGHEEIELALIKLYRLTKDERWVRLARFFIDERGHKCGRPGGHHSQQDHLPVTQQDEIVGHAVRAMYLYSGVADLAAVTGETKYNSALERLWRSVALRKMYVTGGIGHIEHGEGFAKDYELPNHKAYAETCASIGMVLWNHRMFLLHGEGRFMDVLERALYNGALAGVSLKGDLFFYVNPLASVGKHHRNPFYGCACCPTNVVRFIPSLGGWVYAKRGNEIHVNLYVGGTGKIDIPAGEVKITQETGYPWSGKVRLTVEPEKPGDFTVAVRIPGWCGGASAKVNGSALDVSAAKNGYLRIHRAWKKGDAIELDFPMPVRRVDANPKVEANRGRLAVMRGPLVYCLEDEDHGLYVGTIAMRRDAELMPERRPDLLGGVTVLKGKGFVAEGGWGEDLYRAPAEREIDVLMVPYYAWNNRSLGGMNVWIPETTGIAEPAPKPSSSMGGTPMASHCWPHDTVAALNDGEIPGNAKPRFTWWDRKGSTEWVAYRFHEPVKISSSEVWWFQDAGCRPPASYRVLYLDGETWKAVPEAKGLGTELGKFNRTAFKPVNTQMIRIEAKLQEGYSAGILEWRIR